MIEQYCNVSFKPKHEWNVPTQNKTLLIFGAYVSILLCGFLPTQSKTLSIFGVYVSILLSVASVNRGNQCWSLSSNVPFQMVFKLTCQCGTGLFLY